MGRAVGPDAARVVVVGVQCDVALGEALAACEVVGEEALLAAVGDPHGPRGRTRCRAGRGWPRRSRTRAPRGVRPSRGRRRRRRRLRRRRCRPPTASRRPTRRRSPWCCPRRAPRRRASPVHSKSTYARAGAAASATAATAATAAGAAYGAAAASTAEGCNGGAVDAGGGAGAGGVDGRDAVVAGGAGGEADVRRRWCWCSPVLATRLVQLERPSEENSIL